MIFGHAKEQFFHIAICFYRAFVSFFLYHFTLNICPRSPPFSLYIRSEHLSPVLGFSLNIGFSSWHILDISLPRSELTRFLCRPGARVIVHTPFDLSCIYCLFETLHF